MLPPAKSKAMPFPLNQKCSGGATSVEDFTMTMYKAQSITSVSLKCWLHMNQYGCTFRKAQKNGTADIHDYAAFSRETNSLVKPHLNAFL